GWHLGEAVAKVLETFGSLLCRAPARRGLTLAGRRRDRGTLRLGEDLVVVPSLVLALGCLLGGHVGSPGVVVSGRRRDGGLALEDPDRVAERVPEAHVSAIEMLDRLLGEVG